MSVRLQESALCAENATVVQRLLEEGKAKYQPLSLTSLYATSKKTQVPDPDSNATLLPA